MQNAILFEDSRWDTFNNNQFMLIACNRKSDFMVVVLSLKFSWAGMIDYV